MSQDELRTYQPTADLEPREPPVCTEYRRCVGCPYPGHGFVCWNDKDKCIRTEMEKLQGRKRSI